PCRRALLLLVLEVARHDPVGQLVESSSCLDVDMMWTTPVVSHFGGHLVRLSSYRFQLISGLCSMSQLVPRIISWSPTSATLSRICSRCSLEASCILRPMSM